MYIVKIASVLFISMILTCCKNKSETNYSNEIGDSNIPINAGAFDRMVPLFTPDTTSKVSNFHLQWNRIELDNEGYLFVSSKADLSISKYNPDNGEKIMSFGRQGNGPGEFQFINQLLYDSEIGIIAIDNRLLRVNLYDKEGKSIKSIGLVNQTDDVIIKDDQVICSSFLLKPDYKTIKIISAKDEKKIAEFGPILEPQQGLYDKINKTAFKSSLIDGYSFRSMTSLLYIPETNKLIFSQMHPYALWEIDMSDYEAIRFNKKVGFSTLSQEILEIIENGNGIKRTAVKSGRLLHPIRVKNNIIAFINSDDNQNIILDVYNLNCEFTKRLQVPALNKELVLCDYAIDSNKNILYVLVMDKNQLSWIERFKIKETL